MSRIFPHHQRKLCNFALSAVREGSAGLLASQQPCHPPDLNVGLHSKLIMRILCALERAMKSTIATAQATKRPVNLTLSENTVEQARRYTNNLSATVDGLLTEFIAREGQAREEKRQLYAKVSEAWNQFDERYGTFGADHSPL